MLSRRWHNLPPQALIDSSWKTWFHNVIWNCSWKKRIWSHTDGEKVCAVWKPLKLAWELEMFGSEKSGVSVQTFHSMCNSQRAGVYMNSGPLIISFVHYKTAVLKVHSTSQFLQKSNWAWRSVALAISTSISHFTFWCKAWSHPHNEFKSTLITNCNENVDTTNSKKLS